MNKLTRCAFLSGLIVVAFVSAADAAWPVGGIWYSNICRAPSGAYWVYPTYAAQPVGTACTIYTTGEWGVVTAN